MQFWLGLSSGFSTACWHAQTISSHCSSQAALCTIYWSTYKHIPSASCEEIIMSMAQFVYFLLVEMCHMIVRFEVGVCGMINRHCQLWLRMFLQQYGQIEAQFNDFSLIRTQLSGGYFYFTINKSHAMVKLEDWWRQTSSTLTTWVPIREKKNTT